MIVGQAAVLSAIFAGVVALAMIFSGWEIPALRLTLASLAAAYVLAMVLLVRSGLAGIGNLEILGLTDSLSGVRNRRALHLDFARHAIEGEERALALVDLDGFKLINDYYGHAVGDRVIKAAALRLSELCGDEAHFYRLGGDEFAVAVMGPLAGNVLEGLCRRLLKDLASPF